MGILVTGKAQIVTRSKSFKGTMEQLVNSCSNTISFADAFGFEDDVWDSEAEDGLVDNGVEDMNDKIGNSIVKQ